MNIRLYKRKIFIDDVIYTTSNGLVDTSLKSIIMKLPNMSTIFTDAETLIEIYRFIPLTKTRHIINTNSPFQYYPIYFAKGNDLNIVIGTTENYKFIHQLSFNILSKQLRVGITIW